MMAPKLRFSRGLKAKAPGAVTACVPARSDAAHRNRQLAKLLSGFVTGQITVAKVVVMVAAQSLELAWGK